MLPHVSIQNVVHVAQTDKRKRRNGFTRCHMFYKPAIDDPIDLEHYGRFTDEPAQCLFCLASWRA